MDTPGKNDPLYSLMREGKLSLDEPAFEDDIMGEIYELSRRKKAKRAIRQSGLFLAMGILLGGVLCVLYGRWMVPGMIDGHRFYFLSMVLLVLTFLLILEKIMQLFKKMI